MKRKGFSILLVMLLLLGSLVVIDVTVDVIPKVGAKTIYVDDEPGGSPSEDYTSIQDAIDAADPGDTIYVYSGTYLENLAILDKSITLTGENKDTTIIDGGSCSDVVYVTSDSVKIAGFTIIGDVDSVGAGIELDNVQNCEIFDNNVSTNWADYGIYLMFSSQNIIEGNIVSNNHQGVYLFESHGNTITGNTGFDNNFGIYIHFSNGNNISNNYVTNDHYFGIVLGSSSENTIFNNDVSEITLGMSDNNKVLNNNGYIVLIYSNKNNISGNNAPNFEELAGIRLYESNGNNITGNTCISYHNYGIYLWYSDTNNITDNNVSLNSEWGIFLDHSNGNKIIGNNVSSNGRDGIVLNSSNGNNIIGNNLSLNSEMGINLYFSSGNNITNNLMVEEGIFIQGDLLEHWNTHTIDTSNMVNGKAVYYWKNQTEGITPLGAGEIILANCTNITAENQELTSGSVGIEFGFSSNNTILNTTISDQIYGVFSYSSENNSITNCTILNCEHDFALDGNSHFISLNTTFNDANVYFQDSISTLTVKWYLHVNVTNVAGEPIPNALVCIKDNLKTLPPQRCRTKIDGYARWLIETEYVKSKYIKTFHTPHKITAWNETLIGYAEVNMDQSKEVTIVLDTPFNEIPLEPGWNLLSLPLVQSDTSIASVLSSIAGNYEKVMWYNASDLKWHSTDDDLTDLDHTMGFWIYMKTVDTLIVTGDIPNTTYIQLYKGWNLVGNPSFCIHSIDGILESIKDNYTTIWSYYAWDRKDSWKVYNIDKPLELNDLTYITCGRGYWIYVTQDCVWEVSNF